MNPIQRIAISYKYRQYDYTIVLVSENDEFRAAFLDFFVISCGPTNKRGFARVFAVQNCAEALKFVEAGHVCLFVLDDNLKNCNFQEFFAQTQEKKLQQLFAFDPNIKDTETNKRIFQYEVFLLFLNDAASKQEFEAKTAFKPTFLWNLNKPTTLEEIDTVINPKYILRIFHHHDRSPVTYLPLGTEAERKIKEIANRPDRKAFFVRISNFEQLMKPINWALGSEELLVDLHQKEKEALLDREARENLNRFIANIIEQSVDELANDTAWIADYSGVNNCILCIITTPEYIDPIRERIQNYFDAGIHSFCHPELAKLSLAFENEFTLPGGLPEK